MFSHRIEWHTDGTVDITIYPNEGDLVKKIGVRSNNLGELMNDLIPSHLADDLRAKLSMLESAGEKRRFWQKAE
tara:strand:- start:203 stop:424 length:222 start_codon:yes stop_codon:yes gene_type:complete